MLGKLLANLYYVYSIPGYYQLGQFGPGCHPQNILWTEAKP